jgi:phosphate/sulfate permease
MRKKIYWASGLAVVGLYLVQKQTYWLPATFLEDLVKSLLGVSGGALTGYLLGCIVEQVSEQRKRLLKLVYWLLVMAIFGCFLATGKGAPMTLRLTVIACTMGLGLLLGGLQYFWESKKTPINLD